MEHFQYVNVHYKPIPMDVLNHITKEIGVLGALFPAIAAKSALLLVESVFRKQNSDIVKGLKGTIDCQCLKSL